MNDCLSHSSAGSQRTHAGPEAATAAIFERTFASEPDLAQLSYAARRVLAMSAALFQRRGAAATSVRDITRACGLSPGALYNHFASKDDVLYTLVDFGHRRMAQRIDEALAAEPDEPTPRLCGFVRAYVTGHLVHPELAYLVRREYLHLTPERYHEVVDRRRALRDQLTELLRRGQRDGVFRLIDGPDAPTRVGVMVLDMCSRTSDWYDPSRDEAPAELAELYVSAALRLAGA